MKPINQKNTKNESKSMILSIPIDLNVKIRKRCLEFPYCNKTEFIIAVIEEFFDREEKEAKNYV